MAKRKATDYQPDPSNANIGTERGLRALDDSLAKYGAGRSILVDKNGYVIAGNKTLERAVDLGIENVIEVETDGHELVAVRRTDLDLLSDPKARELAYADNRISEIDLAWNAEQLLADLNTGVDLSQFWRDDELAELLASILPQDVPTDPGAQMDKAAELQQKWQVKRGDLWTIGEHRLLCGDSTNADDVARVMAGERADLLLTDPQYGQLKIFQDGQLIGKENVAKRGNYNPSHYQGEGDFKLQPVLEAANGLYSKAVIWGGNYFTDILPITNSWLVWDKRAGERHYFSDCELAWSDIGTAARVFSHAWQGMIRAGEDVERTHPTQKPVELMAWILRDLSPESMLILDLFCGSGTTLVAAHQLGRQGRGIEISEAYCSVVLERMSGLGLSPERV